jgi:hypothetical protein
MSVMTTVTHSLTKLSISTERLVRKYKLDICISEVDLREDKSSSENGIASLPNPVEASSMMLGSVIVPEQSKDEGLEQYNPDVITALFPLGEFARRIVTMDEFLQRIVLCLKLQRINLRESEICGFDVGVADRPRAGTPVYDWYASLITLGTTQEPKVACSAKSLLEACNVSNHTISTASSNCDVMVWYNHEPISRVETDYQDQLVTRLGRTLRFRRLR